MLSGCTHINRLTKANEHKQVGKEHSSNTTTQYSVLTSLFSPTRLPSCQRGSGRSVRSRPWAGDVSRVCDRCFRSCLVPVLSAQRPERAGTSQRQSGPPWEAPEGNKERSYRVARSPPENRNRKRTVPWAQRPQARCSTGSSNLWNTKNYILNLEALGAQKGSNHSNRASLSVSNSSNHCCRTYIITALKRRDGSFKVQFGHKRHVFLVSQVKVAWQ